MFRLMFQISVATMWYTMQIYIVKRLQVFGKLCGDVEELSEGGNEDRKVKM